MKTWTENLQCPGDLCRIPLRVTFERMGEPVRDVGYECPRRHCGARITHSDRDVVVRKVERA